MLNQCKIFRRCCGILCLAALLQTTFLYQPAVFSTSAQEEIAAMTIGPKGPEYVNMKAVSGATAIEGQIVEREGRYGQLSSLSSGRKYYFLDVNDNFLYDLPLDTPVEVTVEYFDEGIGSFELDYDSTEPERYVVRDAYSGEEDIWKAAPAVDLTNTKTWKSHTFYLENMKLSNRCDGGTDLRLGVHGFILNRNSQADVIFGGITLRPVDYINPVKTEITSEQMGSIFKKDDTIDLALTTRNKTEDSVEMSWACSVYDEAGALVYQSEKSVQTYAPGEEKELPMNLANPGRYGIYRAEVSCETRYTNQPEHLYHETVSREFSVAVLHEQGEGNPHYGVGTATFYNYWDTTENASKILQMMGATSTRTGLIWGRMESPKGVINVPEFVTSRVKTLQEYGIDFVALCTMGHGGWSYYTDGDEVPTSEEGIEAFGKYCAGMAKALYPYGVRHLEVWNEYDLTSFNPTNEPPETYVKLLKSAYTAVKEVCPEMQILGLNTYNIQENNRAWLKRALDAGAYNYLDIVSVHPYDYASGKLNTFRDEEYRDKWDKTMELFSQYTDGKPLKPFWITEVGFSTYKDGHTQSSQANSSVLLNAITQGYGYADTLIQFDLYDRSYLGERENNWGLVYAWNDNLGNTIRGAKESFLTMAAYNDFCGKYTEPVEKIEDDRSYAFRNYNSKLGKDVLLLISGHDAEKEESYHLGCQAVEVYDRYGNLMDTVHADNGIYTFQVSTEPLYIVGNFTAFEKSSQKSSVYTERVTEEGTAGDLITFRFTADTEQPLTIRVRETERVTVAENPGFTNGTAELTLATAPDAKGDERVLITVEGADGVRYCQYHTLRIQNPLTADAKVEMTDEADGSRWRVRVTLRNNSHVLDRSGTLGITAPAEAAQYASPKQFTELQPGEARGYIFNLPERKTNTPIDFVLKIDSDGETYTNEIPLDFTICTYAAKKPVIDGEISLGEWKGVWIGEDSQEAAQSIANWGGPEDASFSSITMWDEDNFYLLAIVTDNVHSVSYPLVGNPTYMWQGDSVQVALDDRDSVTAEDRKVFSEFMFGDIPGVGDKAYRSIALYPQKLSAGEIETAQVKIRRHSKYTVYEAAVPWDEIFYEGYQIDASKPMGFAMLANDNDTGKRRGYVTYMSGIAPTKDADLFGKIKFVEK